MRRPWLLTGVSISLLSLLVGLVWLFVAHTEARLSRLEQYVGQQQSRQAAHDEQSRQAVCAVLAHVPPDRGVADQFRDALHCGPYMPSSAHPSPTPSSAASSPSSTRSPQPSGGAGGLGRPSATAGPQRPGGQVPPPSPPAGTSQPAPSPAPVPVPSRSCLVRLLGVCV